MTATESQKESKDSTLLLSLRATARKVQELENSVAGHVMVIRALEQRSSRLRVERDRWHDAFLGMSILAGTVVVAIVIYLATT